MDSLKMKENLCAFLGRGFDSLSLFLWLPRQQGCRLCTDRQVCLETLSRTGKAIRSPSRCYSTREGRFCETRDNWILIPSVSPAPFSPPLCLSARDEIAISENEEEGVRCEGKATVQAKVLTFAKRRDVDVVIASESERKRKDRVKQFLALSVSLFVLPDEDVAA